MAFYSFSSHIHANIWQKEENKIKMEGQKVRDEMKVETIKVNKKSSWGVVKKTLK